MGSGNASFEVKQEGLDLNVLSALLQPFEVGLFQKKQPTHVVRITEQAGFHFQLCLY